MKKTLMIVSLAMTSLLAFGQAKPGFAGVDAKPVNNSPRATMQVDLANQARVNQAQAPVQYNGSIFSSKAENQVAKIEFADFEKAEGTFTTGKVENAATYSGRSFKKHNQTGAGDLWQWLPSNDSADVVNEISENCPKLMNFFGNAANFGRNVKRLFASDKCSGDNGWMIMDLIEEEITSKSYNAYIQFAPVTLSENVKAVDVRLYQYYMKFYDGCYIDYRMEGESTWKTVEINVDGVDIAVNGEIHGSYTFSLPHDAAVAGGKLELRLRSYAWNRSTAGYGYFWWVDDVEILEVEGDRLNFRDSYFVEGLYQTVPQGLELPLFWAGNVYNNGDTDRDITATASVDGQDIAAHHFGVLNIDSAKAVVIDPKGLYSSNDNAAFQGWYGIASGNATEDAQTVPTDQVGDHFAQIRINSADGVIEHNYDELYYNVVDAEDDGFYVWGHDNGVLITNNSFIAGYVEEKGNTYFTPSSAHYGDANYGVCVRFTVGDEVPEDEQGRPWVIRGVELVPAATARYVAAGAVISPVLYYDKYSEEDGSTVTFNYMSTGADNHVVTAEELAECDSAAIMDNGNGFLTTGDYTPIRIMFPEQPELEANKSFRVGYNMEETGFFAVAASAGNAFYEPVDGARQVQYFDSIGMEKYSSNKGQTSQIANVYDIRVYDPTHDETTKSNLWAGYNVNYYPMIHMLVGPRVDLQKFTIKGECEFEDDNEDFGTLYNSSFKEACGEETEYNETSTVYYYAAAGETGEVDQLWIDGELVWSAEKQFLKPEWEEFVDNYGDYGLYVKFENLSADHTVKVHFRYAEHGIENIANNVDMKLVPNPASSQVRLSLQGVTGMVNCAIIDMSGRTVYNQRINAETTQAISLSNLSKGAYFVRVSNAMFNKVEKLIVR